MEVYADIAIHLGCSILTGYGIWNYYGFKKIKLLYYSLFFAFASGVFIDFDHLIDYFFVFGPHFDFNLFIHGASFRLSNKNYVLFHAYEYVVFFALMIPLSKKRVNKMIFTAITLSMLLHLFTDVFIFKVPFQTYFLTYRILTNFTLLPF